MVVMSINKTKLFLTKEQPPHHGASSHVRYTLSGLSGEKFSRHQDLICRRGSLDSRRKRKSSYPLPTTSICKTIWHASSVLVSEHYWIYWNIERLWI